MSHRRDVMHTAGGLPPRSASETAAAEQAGLDGRDGTQLLVEQVQAGREQLGHTVEELAHRLDVKARARDKLGQAKANVAAEVDSLRQKVQEKGTAVGEQGRQALGRPQVRRGAALAGALTGGVLLLRRGRG
jgi:ElaB/YqjD/DUF883 family membrane-anchored ribosome-binding protein